MDLILSLLVSIVAGAAAGLVAWGALRSDVAHAQAAIVELRMTVGQLHERIDALLLLLAGQDIIKPADVGVLARRTSRGH